MKAFFNPNSVAIIGASTNPHKDGNIILRNIIHNGFLGKVFPINPNATEVLGLKAYRSILDVPDTVDLAVVIIPAQSCNQAITECARKGVKSVIIESMGFAEVGEDGKKLQDEIVNIARTHSMRIMGPNCTGIVSKEITTTFFPIPKISKGNIVLIGQSGLLAAGMALDIISNESLKIHTICSIGNKCDVNENDLLEYFGVDPTVSVIAMYLESIADGRRFVPIVTRIAGRKPVIFLAGGRTEAGARAALSHTGSMASNGKILDTVIRQTGCIKADDFSELKDFSKLFATLPIPNGNRVAIVTAAGSVGVVVSDLCDEYKLEIPRLSPSVIEKMKEIFPNNMVPSNPVDLWYSIEKWGLVKTLQTAVSVTLQDPCIDAMILIIAGFNYTMPLLEHKILQKMIQSSDKPIILCMLVGDKKNKNRILEVLGKEVPIFVSLSSGVKALSQLCYYGMNKRSFL